MNELQSANVILERKIRGHLPVTRFSVSETGAVMVAVPDENQPRLYRLGRLSCNGESQEITSFSVETLTSWDSASSGDTFIAATNDDLYVFCGGQKKRFFTDRRDTYVATSITAAGDLFATASADMLMSAYAITLTSTGGKVLWTKDLPLTLTCVNVSPDGRLIAAGSDEGMVVLLDTDRRVIWQFDAGEPITVVCVPTSDARVIIGTRSGTIAALEDAAKLWEAEGQGIVAACTGTPDGRMAFVAREADDEDHIIECLSDEGRVLFHHSAPSAVVSMACSDSGGHIALSCKDGSLRVLEVQGSSTRIADMQEASDLYRNAIDLANMGSYADAVSSLILVLQLDPTNAEASVRLAETAHSLVHESLILVEQSLIRGDFAESVERLNTAWQNCILTPELATEVISARRKAAGEMLLQAQRLAEGDAVEDALTLLKDLLLLDVTNTQARELLGRVEDKLTELLVSQADDALATGHPTEAVRLLVEARDRKPSGAILQRLTQAQCEEALAEGLALYRAQKFSQAVFQFRKVLSIDPGNAEALKHIEYAEKLTDDDALFDRFSRLE